jgi:hypothetical protein
MPSVTKTDITTRNPRIEGDSNKPIPSLLISQGDHRSPLQFSPWPRKLKIEFSSSTKNGISPWNGEIENKSRSKRKVKADRELSQ